MKYEQGNGQGQGRHGQEKARLLQKEIAGAAEELTKTIAPDPGRRPHGGRRSDSGSGGQGGELLYERVPLWDDQYGSHDLEHDRRALKRIQSDEYGVCANCQEELQQKRLEAVPWAKHCIACQEKMEQGLLQ